MIYTKVARIIDSTRVVLAAGERDGVKEGMEFVIYDLSDHILDPETKEDLGQIELVKGRVIAEHVQDKITIVRTPWRELGPFTIRPAWPYEKEKVRGQLKVEGAVGLKEDQVVRVGDLVRSVTELPSIANPVSA